MNVYQPLPLITRVKFRSMDNQALQSVINQNPTLKYKYLGSFSANNLIFPMPENSFQIVNTSNSAKASRHWIILAQKNKLRFYSDSLQSTLGSYRSICRRLPFDTPFMPFNDFVVQKGHLCGLYCIYFAWKLFDDSVIPLITNEFELCKLMSSFL